MSWMSGVMRSRPQHTDRAILGAAIEAEEEKRVFLDDLRQWDMEFEEATGMLPEGSPVTADRVAAAKLREDAVKAIAAERQLSRRPGEPVWLSRDLTEAIQEVYAEAEYSRMCSGLDAYPFEGTAQMLWGTVGMGVGGPLGSALGSALGKGRMS